MLNCKPHALTNFAARVKQKGISDKELAAAYDAVKPEIETLKEELAANDPSFNMSAINQISHEMEESIKELEEDKKQETEELADKFKREDEGAITPAGEEFKEMQEEPAPEKQLNKAQKAIVSQNKEEAEPEPESSLDRAVNGAGNLLTDTAKNMAVLAEKLAKMLINMLIKLLNVVSQAMGKPLDIKPLDNNSKFGLSGASEPAGENDVESPEEIKEQQRGFIENALTSKGNQIRQDLPKNLDAGMPAKEALNAALDCNTEVLDPDNLKFPVDKKNPMAGKESLSDLMAKADKNNPAFEKGAEKRLQNAMKTKEFKQYRKAFEAQNKAYNGLVKMMKNEDFNDMVDNNPELYDAIREFQDNHKESGYQADKAATAYKKHFGSKMGGFASTVENAKYGTSPNLAFMENKADIKLKRERQEAAKVESGQDFKKKSSGMKMS